MVGLLSQEEIETLLRRLRVGRIGCCTDDQPYIVPISYAYDGDAVYAASGPGRKIDIMRAEPQVCFEIDEMDASGGWRSVIADARYQELTVERDRLAAQTLLGTIRAGRHAPPSIAPAAVILFRLDLTAKTGRFGREA